MANRKAAVDGGVRLPRHAWLSATWAGIRDARRGLPQLLVSASSDGPLRPAKSLYRDLLQSSAAEAAHRRRARLFGTDARLAAEVFVAAGVVVEQDQAGSCTEIHRARFRRSLTRWAMRANAHGEWAKATEAQANQRLTCYWRAVSRHHARLRELTRQGAVDVSGWRPEPITLDPGWPSPLELLKHWAVDRHAADAHEYGVLVRALEIVNVAA
jgi:hypothetical protein